MDASWTWHNKYRVWDANRKIFLFPENWIEPEERPSSRIDRHVRDVAKAAQQSRTSVLLTSTQPKSTLVLSGAIAAMLDRNLYRVDLRDVVSKFIGETEKNLDRVFDEASRNQVVLLFDEADALFGKRTDIKDTRDRFANAETTFLLGRIEASTGLSIVATNSTRAVVELLLRRFAFVIDVSGDVKSPGAQ